MRCLLPLLALSGVLVGGVLGGCGYPDIEGTATTSKHFDSSGDDDDDDDSTSAADSEDSEDTDTPSKKGSATDPFANADDFESAFPQLRATSAHSGGGAGVVPDYKQQCLSCHTGSPGPKFGFGGTVYKDADLSTPGKSVQIGIVDSAGAAVITTADADGNFWMEDAPKMKFPVYAAARDGSGKKMMATKITSAEQLDCNSCHGTSNPLIK